MYGRILIFAAFFFGIATLSFGRSPDTSGESAPRNFFLADPKASITPKTVPDGLYGSAYKNQHLKVSGGGDASFSFSVSAGNLPPGMSLSGDGDLSGTPTAAGAYPFTITAAGKSGRGNGNGNNGDKGSRSATQDYTLLVGMAAMMITANNAATTFGGTIPALAVTYNGFVNGDGVSSLNTPAVATTMATPASTAGVYPITASGAASPNYVFSYRSGTLNINPATLSVNANAQTKEYGTADPALTYSSSGFVNGNDAGLFTGKLSRTPGEAVGKYSITVGNLSAGRNYSINFTGNELTISPASEAKKPKISPNSVPGGIYGTAYNTQHLKVTGGDGSYSFAVSNGSLPPGMTLSGDGTLSGTPNVAGAYSFSITATGQSGNTNPVSQDYNLIINQAALTITAGNAAMTYGGVLPVFGFTYSGFVNGDNAASLTSAPVATTTATSSSPAGNYSIVPSGAASTNYKIVYNPGTLTIGKAIMAVTANPQTKDYGAADPPLSYTAIGFVNGDNSGIFTGGLTRVPGESAGNYAISIGSLSAGRNYTISFTGNILTISPASQKPKIAPNSVPGGIYGSVYNTQSLKVTGGDGSYTFAVSNGSLPPGITLSGDGTLSGTPTAAGAYSFSITATGQSGNANLATQDYKLVVDRVSLTITAGNAAMTYGGALPAFGVSYSGFVNGDNAASLTTVPAISTTATSSSPAGNYAITPSGASSANYTFVYNPGTLTISPASLTITASPETKEYGTADPTLAFTASGFVNGDNFGIFTGRLTRDPGENAGQYAITIGSLSAGPNYTISYTGNYLTITPVSKQQKINWTQNLLVGCNSSTTIQLNAAASSGLPVTYSVADTSIATISGNILTLLRTGSTVITASQPGDANHTAAAPVSDTLFYQSTSLIRQHWNDVVFFDNTTGNFVQWQWYKNGQAIPGATGPYYTETPSLNGRYYVIATNAARQQIQTCTLTINGDSIVSGGIKVQPNPIHAGGIVTVTCNYSGSILQGGILQVIDMNGKVRQRVSPVLPTMKVTMPVDPGIYIINLLLSNGQKASVNVLLD
jgi:hypothetical protein